MNPVVRVLFVAFVCSSFAVADEWGTLKGRITYAGPVPKPEKLEITRDEEVCGPVNLVDESLLVNENSQSQIRTSNFN